MSPDWFGFTEVTSNAGDVAGLGWAWITAGVTKTAMPAAGSSLRPNLSARKNGSIMIPCLRMIVLKLSPAGR